MPELQVLDFPGRLYMSAQAGVNRCCVVLLLQLWSLMQTCITRCRVGHSLACRFLLSWNCQIRLEMYRSLQTVVNYFFFFFTHFYLSVGTLPLGEACCCFWLSRAQRGRACLLVSLPCGKALLSSTCSWGAVCCWSSCSWHCYILIWTSFL